MSKTISFKNIKFSVGDVVKVTQNIEEGKKHRIYNFEGLVIAIKGSPQNKTFTVRKIGAAQIGIERIFPIMLDSIENITVVKKGGKGIRRAKLYYVRKKSRKEIEKIYSRTSKKEQ